MLKLKPALPILLTLLLVFWVSGLTHFGLGKASAATYFTHVSVVPLNMTANASNVVLAVQVTTATADAAASMTINFSSLTGGSVASIAGFATSYGGQACTSAYYFNGGSILPTTSPAVSGSGTQITLSGVNLLTATTSYCFFVGTTTGMQNPNFNASGYTATIQDGAADQATVGLFYLSNDQITVTATVPPTFTMALSGNTDTMTLSISAAVYSSSGVTATLTTNAANGWQLWAEDSNQGLKSAAAGNHVIPSVAVGSLYTFSTNTGAEHYGIAVNSIANATVSGNYTYNAGTFTGGGLTNTTLYPVASYASPIGGTGSQVKVYEAATASATTPAANDYTDVITLVGAGKF